jgi:hypothetical protein
MPKKEIPTKDEEEVLTPGGMRPKSAVHHVEPGQMVEETADVSTETESKSVVSDAEPEESAMDAGTRYEPAGMRPKSNLDLGAHEDPPGMRPNSNLDSGTHEEPAGMRPKSNLDLGMHEEPAGMRPQSNLNVVTREEPAGMRPKSVAVSGTSYGPSGSHAMSAPSDVTMNAPASGDLVRTPGGYRNKSMVHPIEPGHYLELADGNIKKMQISGREVLNFGPLRLRPSLEPLMPGNVSQATDLPARGMSTAAVVPALASGWISYAYWTNSTGHAVSRFSTTWVVPPPPATNHGQTIFLFNGIQNSTMIYQPVLQWGPSAAGGGNYWSVASWYVDGQGGLAFHTNLVQVNPGDVLVGVMWQTGQSGTQFSYNCDFTGIANTALPISNVQELTWNIETLEAYGCQQCSDYPDTNFTAFVGIDFQTSAGRPALNWTRVNAISDCGQNARVVSNANPGGEVDIYYRQHVDVQESTAAINNDGRLETFLRATSGSVWNIWQKFPHAGPWSPISGLGGIVLRPVCSALNTDGRLEIFGVGTDNAAYNNWQTAAHAGPWSGWNRLGGWVSQLAVACNSDGRLELFGIGSDGALYNMWQTAPHAGPWSGWNRLGGWVKQICVSLNTDGRLEVFGIGSDNALYNIWQTAAHAGPWSGWNRLGGWVKQIVSDVNSDGRLEVFGIGSDNAVYNIWQTAAHAGPWSGWNRLGGWVKQVISKRNSDGRLEVFGIGSDNALYNIWQTVPHAGPWSGWNRLGGWVSQISTERNSDGRLEVFGIGSDSNLYNIWQTAPHAGPWSGFNRLT